MNVAIMGFGVVGSGVAEVISKNAPVIKENSNVSLSLSHILDIRDFENNEFSKYMTKNFDDILNDDDTQIVVETMGGVEPAFTFVSKCLEKGKHVVTSNKELVAKKGFELLSLAKKNNVNFLFEASVGGGIPIIRPISRCLAGNRINQIMGILNGTTNFILTKMIMDNMDFADALKLAQDNGYAEKDPTADVEGIDACRKICILSSLVFGSHVYPDGIYTEGITKVSLRDVECAGKAGYVIKLIAQAKKLDNGKANIIVSPALVRKDSMLAGVSDVFNACLVRGDATGDVLMYGKGAGKLATASAVVGDVIDCASNFDNRKFFGWGEAKENFVEDHLKVSASLFVRAETSDKENDINKVKLALEDCRIVETSDSELAFITAEEPEGDLRAKLSSLGLDIKSTIRIADC